MRCPEELMKVMVLSALATMLLVTCSCTETKYVTVESSHTDTLYAYSQRTDTVIMKDSTVIRTAGDTVYADRWHVCYKVRERTDTLYHAIIDTIPVPYEVEKTVEVEKPLSWWEKTQIRGFRVLALVLVLWLLWRYRRNIVSLIKALISRI